MKSPLLEVDRGLFLVTLLLVVVGLIMILNASAVSAYRMVDQTHYFFYRQLVWSLVGLVACLFAATLPMDLIRKVSPLLYVVGLLLLVAVLFPGFGREVSGAWRWIDLGVIGFQPSKLSKLFLVLVTALYLSTVELSPGRRVSHLITILVLTFLYVLLIGVEPDLSTATQVGFIGLVMLFLSGFPVSHLLSVIILSIPAGALAVFSRGYRSERVLSYLEPWSDPLGGGYHTIQSLKALSRGGLLGLGLGESVAKKGYLPEPYTDSIMAVIGEELGLIGLSLLILPVGYLIFKGFSISLKTRDSYQKLLAGGLVSMIGVQVVLNLAVVSGLIPTTGVAMPFISYGGSSLVINLVAVGLILNVSRTSSRV